MSGCVKNRGIPTRAVAYWMVDTKGTRRRAQGIKMMKSILSYPYALRLTPCAISLCLPEFEIEGCLSLFTKKIDKNIRTIGDDTVDTHFDEPLHVIF